MLLSVVFFVSPHDASQDCPAMLRTGPPQKKFFGRVERKAHIDGPSQIRITVVFGPRPVPRPAGRIAHEKAAPLINAPIRIFE